jgi:hypothetical protein
MVKFTHPDGYFFDERNFCRHQLQSLLGPKSGLSMMANAGTVLVEEPAL